MNTLKIATILILSSFFMLFSCKKDDITANKNAPGDAALSQYLFNALKDEVDQQINRQGLLNGFQNQDAGDRGGCANVTISPLGTTFPKTVIISFPDGCTTFAGAQIKGTVQLSISGKVRDNGTIIRYSLNAFEYKKHLISGDYTITFSDPFTHRTEVQNGSIITPEGKNIRFNSINTATQIEGRETTYRSHPLTFLLDDAYQVTTTCWGTNSRGNEFMVTPVTPLVYRIACQWITSGLLNIQEEGLPDFNALLDYGDGTCDNKATVTIGNLVREIRLP